jgi:hypothetical protein
MKISILPSTDPSLFESDHLYILVVSAARCHRSGLRCKETDLVWTVSIRDFACTSHVLARRHPKRHCWLRTRNVSQVEAVTERYQVSLSSHGKVVGFPRSCWGAMEAAQLVERMCRLVGCTDLEEVQVVDRILLMTGVKEEVQVEAHTDLCHLRKRVSQNRFSM